MSNIIFPEGITWSQRYVTGGDFVPVGTELNSVGNLYKYASNGTIKVDFDTSNVTNMSLMFLACRSLTTITQFDTSSVVDMQQMFSSCSLLISIPHFNTSNVTNMSYMFNECKQLTSIPQLDTSKVKNMSYMFYNCSNLTTIPQLDTSSVTTVERVFYKCSRLIELPNFNCVKLTNFGGSSSFTWLYDCYKIKKIGVVDCDSVTNIGYFFGYSALNSLTDFGGCRNLGKANYVSNTSGSYFMNYAPNLTYESVMNVLNGLYDRATAGLSVLTLKLHANHLAMLSEDDITIATNKGWTIV